jgi:hypothetical protein
MSTSFNSISRLNAPDPMAQFLDAADPIYGTGVDGSVVLDGSTTILGMAPASSKYTMTSDLYFHNLTLNANIHLQTSGYRLFVKNQLNMADGSRIGFTTGFSTAGSIAQGGGILESVTNSLGGSAQSYLGIDYLATAPTAALGGAKYYTIPHQAIRGWAASASATTPTFLRGGAGGFDEPGGGIVIIAARYITVTSGTATISAPGGTIAGAGGGVILIVSSHSALPAGLSTDVTGQNAGTVNYMQLV